MKGGLLLQILLVCGVASAAEVRQDEIYPLDTSWPIQTTKSSRFQERYENFMKGCDAHNPPMLCELSESERFWRNRNQPALMTNYTRDGFGISKIPDDLFDEITYFFEENRGSVERREPSGPHPTYINAWEANIGFLSMFADEHELLRNWITGDMKAILEEWSGEELEFHVMYGVRLYYNNAILTPHVDTMPRVISAILNVAQDVDEPWPLEVYDHDGLPHNVTIQPGEVIMYESGTIVHGRPFPMKGRFYANIFVHFSPHSTKEEVRRIGIMQEKRMRRTTKATENLKEKRKEEL